MPLSTVNNSSLETGLGLIPAGAVQFFARQTAPSGWLAADGSAVSRSTYATLFAAIGTTFGTGDGSTTFNLPNMGGQFPRGWVSGQTTDSGRAFGSSQTDALKTHTHTYNEVNFNSTQNQSSGSGTGWVGKASSNTGNPSTGTSTETRPVNIALLVCIKT